MDLIIDTLVCLRYHMLYVFSIVQKRFIHGHNIGMPLWYVVHLATHLDLVSVFKIQISSTTVHCSLYQQ
jgi:hypothetical protein